MLSRKQKAILHHELIDILLKDVKIDEEYFGRLLYALEIITIELNSFSDFIKDEEK